MLISSLSAWWIYHVTDLAVIQILDWLFSFATLSLQPIILEANFAEVSHAKLDVANDDFTPIFQDIFDDFKTQWSCP